MENQQASAVAEAEETTLSVLEEYASLESTGSITAHHRAQLRRHAAATGTKESVCERGEFCINWLLLMDVVCNTLYTYNCRS